MFFKVYEIDQKRNIFKIECSIFTMKKYVRDEYKGTEGSKGICKAKYFLKPSFAEISLGIWEWPLSLFTGCLGYKLSSGNTGITLAFAGVPQILTYIGARVAEIGAFGKNLKYAIKELKGEDTI